MLKSPAVRLSAKRNGSARVVYQGYGGGRGHLASMRGAEVMGICQTCSCRDSHVKLRVTAGRD